MAKERESEWHVAAESAIFGNIHICFGVIAKIIWGKYSKIRAWKYHTDSLFVWAAITKYHNLGGL